VRGVHRPPDRHAAASRSVTRDRRCCLRGTRKSSAPDASGGVLRAG
jgi:hypothetical protein